MFECKWCKEKVSLLYCYDGKWLCSQCTWDDGVRGWQTLLGREEGHMKGEGNKEHVKQKPKQPIFATSCVTPEW